MTSQEFNKYAEDDDEDYDDVFGKPNGSCACLFFVSYVTLPIGLIVYLSAHRSA